MLYRAAWLNQISLRLFTFARKGSWFSIRVVTVLRTHSFEFSLPVRDSGLLSQLLGLKFLDSAISVGKECLSFNQCSRVGTVRDLYSLQSTL